jgi:DNA excision repair protein ERCC-4
VRFPANPPCRLDVDVSERHAVLADLARQCGRFDVRSVRLVTGDYLIDKRVLVERKTLADFAASLADGRLFPQAAALARSPHRPVVLIEGPTPLHMPAVHPHAIDGAIVSLAVMWRLPILHAADPDHSLRLLLFLADQAGRSREVVLRRYDRKPKRLASRRLYALQGLPGVGPAIARRLLTRFGSLEKVFAADIAELCEVRGLGRKKANLIRELITE